MGVPVKSALGPAAPPPLLGWLSEEEPPGGVTSVPGLGVVPGVTSGVAGPRACEKSKPASRSKLEHEFRTAREARSWSPSESFTCVRGEGWWVRGEG